MAGSKVLCTCILIFIIMSSQAEARRLMGAASYGNAVAEGGASFKAKREMATATSTEEGGEWMTMQMTATTDSRPTAPGNSPGIGNKGEITN
ncbi:hypothetical protein PR202_ga21262 [Eleusine coracana subsp. coracana]|uniref:Uncharacterized protein n=1 Tax=Eleusine coracana subsp. coracana TaxID=191504 RepID=A0AAV5D0J3_ELECO|nr:hypothetical protein QOZ80_8AG0634360 [Eleusine coracana subsp. coracana]GJN03784.1 hypothetical protein PR202_ga21262 [Eleusine coracana subsp. coracana]